MKMTPLSLLANAVILFSDLTYAGIGTADGARAAEKPPIPDFTQSGKKDDSHDWTLGPTGARGWVYGRNGQTSDARQILVTAVDAGSPAADILRVNDVILGVDGKVFTSDARISFARAITVAEETSGVLPLIRWRDGQTANVDLKLPVLGAYHDTAPYNCPKSKAIFQQGCRLIAKNGLGNADIPIDLNALALLASGKQEYRPMLADYAKKVAAPPHPDVWTWYYGYGNLFLAEYVLATGKNGLAYEGRTTEQLLAGLSSWSPTVRQRSARTLGQREGDFVPQLLQMLGGSNRYARYGACEALGGLGPPADAAAPQLRALLKDPDSWMQSPACNAIRGLGPEARKAAANDLLALAARKNAADPRRMSQRAVANALFEPYPGSGGPQGILAGSLSGVDRQEFFNKSIAEIDAATESPPLVSLKDFILQASASGDASNHTKNGTP